MALRTQALAEDAALGWDGWEAVRCVACRWFGFAEDLEYSTDESRDGMNYCPKCGDEDYVTDGHGPFSWWEPEQKEESKCE